MQYPSSTYRVGGNSKELHMEICALYVSHLILTLLVGKTLLVTLKKIS
jgi:hypothetical protein